MNLHKENSGNVYNTNVIPVMCVPCVHFIKQQGYNNSRNNKETFQEGLKPS